MKPLNWTELVEKKAMLMHRITDVVGRAEKYYDGVNEVYISRANGMPTKGPVIEFEEGHAFFASDDFIVLSAAEIRFLESMREGFAGLITIAAKNASDQGVDLDRGLSLLTSIFEAQLAALKSG